MAHNGVVMLNLATHALFSTMVEAHFYSASVAIVDSDIGVDWYWLIGRHSSKSPQSPWKVRYC